jgi:hypothetical protein
MLQKEPLKKMPSMHANAMRRSPKSAVLLEEGEVRNRGERMEVDGRC